jgi:hypothetical protein
METSEKVASFEGTVHFGEEIQLENLLSAEIEQLVKHPVLG